MGMGHDKHCRSIARKEETKTVNQFRMISRLFFKIFLGISNALFHPVSMTAEHTSISIHLSKHALNTTLRGLHILLDGG